jgi:hypothetical protein
MGFLNTRTENEIKNLKNVFKKTMFNNYMIFEGNAFRRLASGDSYFSFWLKGNERKLLLKS